MNMNVESCGESSGCEGMVGVVFGPSSLWSVEG